MVGVPGRSKACATCRKRGKGCDLQRPACSQCIKIGLECGGYERRQVFVVSTQESRRNKYSIKPPPRRDCPRDRAHGWDVCSATPPSSEFAPSRMLTRSAHESQYLDLFWEAYLPNGRPVPERLLRNFTCCWTEVARKLYTEDDCLRYALWANCLGNLHVRGGDRWLEAESIKLYGKALAALSGALQVPERAKSDALLVAVKLLGLFEVFFSLDRTTNYASSQDWDRHSAGELALLVARKPHAHVRGDAHLMFTDMRVHLLLQAIKKRKRTILSTDEWKTIPWMERQKDMKDIIVDVLVDIPRLLEDLDDLRACKDEYRQPSLRRDLIQQCYRYDRQLLSWHKGLSSEENFCRYQIPGLETAQIPIGERGRIEAMSIFWAICLVVYATLSEVSPQQTGFSDRTNLQQYATKLVQVVPRLVCPGAGLYSQDVAALPLALALPVMEKIDSLRDQYTLLMSNLKRMPGEDVGGLCRRLSSPLATPCPNVAEAR